MAGGKWPGEFCHLQSRVRELKKQAEKVGLRSPNGLVGRSAPLGPNAHYVGRFTPWELSGLAAAEILRHAGLRAGICGQPVCCVDCYAI